MGNEEGLTVTDENTIETDRSAEPSACEPAIEPSEWLSTREAAEALGLSPATLRDYRTPARRRGPDFTKTAGGAVRYRRADVLLFAEGRA